MKGIRLFINLLPFLLSAQPFNPFGKSKIFLNSFLNLQVFPSSINGYSNFVSITDKGVGFLYKPLKNTGFYISTEGNSIYSAANFTRNFWDFGILAIYSSDQWGSVMALGYRTPFSRIDISAWVEEGKFKELNLKYERELSAQKMIGTWINLNRDSLTALIDLMISPTENRIFFLGAGASSGKELIVTMGGYFPIFDLLFMEISGDFIYHEDSTYVVKRWGLGLEKSDFMGEVYLNPRLMGYVPYFLTGNRVDFTPLISVSFIYRFHTF